MNQLNKIVFEILGDGHPIINRIQSRDPELSVDEVFGAALGVLLAEIHSLSNRIEVFETMHIGVEDRMEMNNGE